MINQILQPFAKYLPQNNTLERIWVLAKVDFKSRYYYHKLGMLWALIRPIIELVVYYTIFNTIFTSDIENFVLYLCGGLLLWYYFSEGTTRGISALLSKRYLIESVPFNKTYIIVATTLSSFFGFCFNTLAYFIISIVLGQFPQFPYIIQLIPILITLSILIMGFSFILSTLSIYFKDIQHLWDMVILAGFWVTPIVYSEQLILQKMPIAVQVNPIAGLLINLHEVLLYDQWMTMEYFWNAFFISFAIFIIGLFIFTNYSHKAAEKL